MYMYHVRCINGIYTSNYTKVASSITEKEKDEDPSAFSWWSDSHNRPNQSQWLQATISDLDDKTKAIANLIQDDSDSFAKRAEMFYKRRPELIKSVQDLYTSYRSLAEKYETLRSESVFANSLLRSSSSSSLNQSKQPHLTKISINDDGREIIGLENVTNSIEFDEIKNGVLDFGIGRVEKEKVREELRLEFLKHFEGSLEQKSELVRRNGENKEVIKHLRGQIKKLMEENKVLKSYLPSHRIGIRGIQKSRVSKLKGVKCIEKLKFEG